MMKILVINLGSTSSKIAVYENETKIFAAKIEHSTEDLNKCPTINDQLGMRKSKIIEKLTSSGHQLNDFNCIVSRGGILQPVKSGAYAINNTMIERIRDKPRIEHASNLSGIIAKEIADDIGIKAFIYDSPMVDELNSLARISGLPQIPRKSAFHALNTRAMGHRYAQEKGKSYAELTLIIAHIGGGTTISLHEKGQVSDIVSDDEGAFSTERAGALPCSDLLDFCYSGKYSKAEAKKKLRGQGGMVAHLGTNDCKEVENRALNGDEKCKLILDAMCYAVAKSMAGLAATVCGKVDAIIITGGIANSKYISGEISKRVSFIAPVEVMAGEDEMQALAFGALRVLRGQELAKEYKE